MLDEKQLLETMDINVEDITEDKRKRNSSRRMPRRNRLMCSVYLIKVFERKSVFSKLFLKKKLLALKFKPKEKLEHLLSFDGLVNDLENAGAKMDDMDKICNLLLIMGDNSNTVVTAIETMKQDLTMEFVKCRLLEEEMK
ncbi:hypothetical protein PR048_021468 [Dryococelus australis]|uniref:Uncharacterized protein n=1 Tax=Dryococelus australis TaxID=614101 RepID=A0ABQ9GYB1_9NEOP|nr:hypothetical protein PR048_021468 [Dryococelus australis]